MNNGQSAEHRKKRIALILVLSILNFVAVPLYPRFSLNVEAAPLNAVDGPYIPTFIRRVNLQANNLVYSQATQALYASVQSRDGPRGNSITKIIPATGEIGPSVFICNEPDRMAISDDGTMIWTHLNNVNVVRGFDVLTETAGLQFFTGSRTIQPPLDMDVVPGHPHSVVLSRGFSQDSAGSVVVFDN